VIKAENETKARVQAAKALTIVFPAIIGFHDATFAIAAFAANQDMFSGYAFHALS
jgi:hypothetical protein